MKVLLIDDDPLILRSLARWFRGEDHEVLTATSVRNALETWGWVDSEGKVELIVTDFNLGEGTTAADLPLLADGSPPFIVSTGTPRDVPKDLREGALGLLHKPFDADDLRKLVSEVTG
jgi:DNA-binding NtrC family response regulator